MSRAPSLQHFIDVTQSAILARLDAASAAGAVAGKIFAAAHQPALDHSRATPQRLPVCAYLPAALDNSRGESADLAAIADAFQEIEPGLSWRQRAGAAAAGETFAQGHANAVILGPDGLEQRQDIRIGVSLMAPQIQYIDHHHPPAEVYLVLSQGAWRQKANPWHEPGIGGTVFNTPHILHAMKSGEQPLFALWCLLVQDTVAS